MAPPYHRAERRGRPLWREEALAAVQDDVEHALATGALDPLLPPDLPKVGPCDLEVFDDPLDLPEVLQTGAEHRGDQETDVWVASVPVDVAHLFRAAHHQRGVHGGVIRIAGRASDGLVFEMPLGRFRSGDRVLAR